VPERKGQPAIVRLYDLSSFKQALSQKTFFRADTAQYYWNVLGTSVLVLTHTEMDKTGKSYYGETGLYYLATTGKFDCRVELNQPGFLSISNA
jgi:translation initiation factor 2A